jgi:hypothetical protein
MRDTLFTLGLMLAIFLGIVAQYFIPPLSMAEGARWYFAPIFFCYGACTLPFPSMIALAFTAGFLSDFNSLQIVERVNASSDAYAVHTLVASVEIPPGWSILLFVAVGLICQGLRPLVLRGHWWLPALTSAGATVLYLALQFGMITMRRFESGGLYWSEVVAWRILAPAVIALVLTLALTLVVMFVDGVRDGGRRSLREF